MGVRRFLLFVLAGLLLAGAVFLLAAAFLVASVVAAGLGVLLAGWGLVQGRLYVEVPGRIIFVDQSYARLFFVTVRADDPHVLVENPVVGKRRPPEPGTPIPILVPMHRHGPTVVRLTRTGTPADGPVLLLNRIRIAFRRHHWWFGRPISRDRSVVDVLDTVAELISEAVLDWHRERCKRFAAPLQSTSEFLGLSAAFDTNWGTIVRRGLQDQDDLFDDTERSREEAFRRLSWLPLFTLAAIPLVIFAVPRFVQVLWAVLQSLFDGSSEPFTDVVHWDQAVRNSGLPPLDLYVALTCAAICAAGVAWWASRTTIAALHAYHAWRADLTGAIRRRLLEEYVKVANALDPPTLQIRTAPGLAGLATDQVIVRSEAARLQALAFDLGAGAVAISGSRGVGKTTLLTMLTDAETETTLGLLVAAPVRYEPRDFVLHLYARLCTVVLDRLGARQAPSRLRRFLLHGRQAAAGVIRALAILCLFTVFFPGTRDWLAAHLPVPELPATWLLAAVTLLLVGAWVQGPRQARAIALATEASHRLRQTRYLQTVSAERSAGVGQSSIQLGWRRARQWAEQPYALPDLVQSYREFATEVAAWWRAESDGRGKLLIGIDEADRISDPAAAELFVNEIKAVFGVPHCVYLVSVSEEALANFERRVVRMRTVFDSAFDHVIRLRALTLRESVDLLQHRIAGVPDRFWMLCHCLAGGMPRDVLRAARNMIDLHRSSPGASPVADLALRMVDLEVQAVKRGFRQQHTDDPKLGELLADPVWPGTTSTDLREAAEEQFAGSTAAAMAIGAALLYYATVLELFTEEGDLLDVWDDQDADAPEPDLITDLARVHGLLAFDASVAVQQLRGIQARLASE